MVWRRFLDMWGPVPLVALRSMRPHVALEGQGIGKIPATGGTGEKTCLVAPLEADLATWVTKGTLTLLTAIRVGDPIHMLTVLVSR